MSLDDTHDDAGAEAEEGSVRERLGEEADRAVETLDDGLVELLTWILDTETRARIYIYLREQPRSTSDEIAEGTGLYPSTVREALAELNAEEKVTRSKRESAGAGNNPYEYVAIKPGDLVADVAGDVQQGLNTVFNLDDRLADRTVETEPVTITVDRSSDGENASAESDD
ncbi:winged helix-turn-helix domain-containing protein [Halomarina oriensis]|uniref:Winged helix-turn-helix transcriptional regulator n=1 Tax=Halomarina oriensis TaxID=671145 RepID=A0A6B0GP27_9EURY|nr:winged helix-turn-helix domain-containing protein [Halomarina oriensis]MWG33895.1 winged helix-turn-helix transcriptional regulator [Halomarina oriensis]